MLVRACRFESGRGYMKSLLQTAGWRLRWLCKYFPKQAYLRFRHCRGEHQGPLYDGYLACLTCGAPWFKQEL